VSKPLIFISHSAKDVLAHDILNQLPPVLEPDFEVLLDQYRLQANDPWRNELDVWMSLCHAAVILFSSDALASTWVLQEATILRWRRARDPNFVVVPVLIPPVTHNDLDQNPGFAPLALNEIQMLAADTSADVVNLIGQRLDPIKKRFDRARPFWELVDLLAAKLAELETRAPKALQDAAGKLGKTLSWRSDNKYSEELARLLLSAEFSQMSDAVLLLAPYFASVTTAVEIMDRLAPFWVSAQAVVRLPDMINLPQKERAVCVNGTRYQFTPKSYLGRARGGLIPWVSATVTLPPGLEEQPKLQMTLAEQTVVKELRDKLGLGEEDDLFDADNDEMVAEIEKTEPLFIIVPGELSDDVLDQLRNRFHRFTFFLLKDDKSVKPEQLTLKKIELLEPKLDPEVEAGAAKLYLITKGSLQRLRRG
jgi:hypothetical protein